MTKLAVAAVAITIGGLSFGQQAQTAFGQEPRIDDECATVCPFYAGYLDGSRGEAWLLDLAVHVADVIDCESGWQTRPEGYHLGLGQFAPETWAANARAGADPGDPYEQGFAVATLIRRLGERGVSPGSTAGWPACWWVRFREKPENTLVM